MNHSNVLNAIKELGKFGIHLGLERIDKLLTLMGHPEQSLRFVHIAGTNGKGSTATMLTHILKAAGYKVGLFTSPAICSFHETMQINHTPINDIDLEACATYVLSLLPNATVYGESPTQFEVTTAIALEWFKRSECDIVCLEVGMGGLLDSTNIIPPPLMQIITAIGMDHSALLGGTLAEIAQQKAGIIKGGTTISYPLQEQEVLDVIKAKCQQVNSLLVVPNLNTLQLLDETSFEQLDFIYEGALYHKSLIGKFQIYNALTALTAAKSLRNYGFHITTTHMQNGISSAFIPARMECFSKKPLILLDGAHNAHGAMALVGSLRKLKVSKVTVLMGILADKDYTNYLSIIYPLVDTLIAVTPHNPRALSGDALCAHAEQFGLSAIVCPDLANALDLALNKVKPNEALIICGSLYLAADLRPMLLAKYPQIKS